MSNMAKSANSYKLNDFIRKDTNLFRLVAILAFVFVLMSILKPDLFLQSGNFISMAKQFPEFGILAIAISITMITGGIDLSVVATANLSAIVAAKFLIATVPAGSAQFFTIEMIIVAIVIAIITGVIAGAVNGFLISKIGIPAILATLGTYQLFSGIAIVFTKGRSISGLPMLYSQTGNKELFGYIPVPLVIFIVVAIIIGIFLAKTKSGMQLYLFGTNEKASLFSGLNNTWITMRTYMISGGLSAVAGLIMMARANSVNPDYGSDYTLQCVLIAVLGGINPKGGFGNIQGVTVAIIILQILSSGLNMFENISNFYRDIIWGGVLVLVLVFNYYINKREQRKLAQ
ncbi:ABC transporter permease [Cohnella sp. WQ 127256]|uniref:ABC transporter permease n=1 Tax=Cohnella sp. WQ 127256 TaxID=2938790 RepID=UPI0021180C93|nr:ABC transporter permease [Cohnella sp. WQ 127256]